LPGTFAGTSLGLVFLGAAWANFATKDIKS
jgi:hypothetical protein